MKVLFLFFTDPPRPFSSSVAALAAVVRAAGHEPLALEVLLSRPIAEIAAQIAALAPDVLAVSAMSRDWPGAHRLLLDLDAPGRPFVVVGGYHASMAPADVAACATVDAIGIGEGERPLTALLSALETGRPTRSLPGMWVRGPEGFVGPPPGPDPEPDIASLPAWDYEVFGAMGAHLDAGINTFGPRIDRYLPVRASRGCPFTCAYCSAPKWGRMHAFSDVSRRNTLPVDQLCAELARLRDRYAPEGFEFWDEHFPVQLSWLEAFAEVYPRVVGLPFKVEMHPNAATRKRLTLLKRAGCVLFHCGVEAGDETLRRQTLDRRTKDSELQRVFDDCRELGLETSASLMTTLPGETRAQAHATVELLERLRPGSFMWSNYHALPGTVLGEAAVPAWPGPARARFNDFDVVEPTLPALQNAQERDQTFRELTDLQRALVRASGAEDIARPVEIPNPPRPGSPAFAAFLGIDPGGRVPQRGPRLIGVVVDPRVVTLELDAPGMEPRQVVIKPRSGGGCFVATDGLEFSYKGKDAPEPLLDAIRIIARRLARSDFEALQTAAEA
ncbi:MAG: hypothetical protein RIT45_1784 [Pseudomonadota bacterium]|jgi:radical SAM superfamily enzyme YgiQ (UPF0313 family)